MDITASNFRATLPLVLDAISAADFVAIDGEFSGLRRDTDDQAFSVMDTLDERYKKVAASTREFGLLQIGLSCFQFDASKRQYVTATFSFYLLKKMTAIYSPNTFTVCSNSLRFLASNKFDFNKLFSDGLPYLNQEEALQKRSRLPDRIVERLGVGAEKPSVQDAFSNVYKLIKKHVAAETGALGGQSERGPAPCHNNGTSRGFDIGDGFQPSDLLEVPVSQLHSPAHYAAPSHTVKKFSLKDVKRSFWKQLRLLVTSDCPNTDAAIDYENTSIVVRTFATQRERDLYVYYDEIDSFYDAVGFSHIAVHLLEARTPLVGHNCVLDVLHLIDKCLEPLPHTLASFKELYTANFTLLYDTKLIVFDAPFASELPNTGLRSVYELAVKSCPKLAVRQGCESYSLKGRSGAQEHDAGYDAFMTAVSFVGLVRKLEGGRGKDRSVIRSPQLAKFANRIYVMQICDMHVLHLAGKDDEVDRSGVFVVTSSSELRYNLVKTFFPDLASPNILSDFSSNHRHFVLPSTDADRKRAPALLRKAQTLCPSSVAISMYTCKARTSESMETSESLSTAAFNVTLKSKSIPPALPSNTSPTRMSVESANELEQDGGLLTPRTAHLAKNSTLSAKSPEFTPASSHMSKESFRTLNASLQSPSGFLGEDPTENQKEDLGVVVSEDKIEDEKPCSVPAYDHPKRGEKRKSGQQCDEVQMTEVEEEFSQAESCKDDSADWHTVRNRNRFQNWRGGSSSCNIANRFMPAKEAGQQDDHASDEDHASRRRGKRSRTGDARPTTRSSGLLGDEAVPQLTAAPAGGDGARAPGAGVLKRLKSVGTEQFSSLSLDSPTGDGVFSCPATLDAGGHCTAGDAVLPAASVPLSGGGGAVQQEDLEEVLQQQRTARQTAAKADGRQRAPNTDQENNQCFQVPDDW